MPHTYEESLEETHAYQSKAGLLTNMHACFSTVPCCPKLQCPKQASMLLNP